MTSNLRDFLFGNFQTDPYILESEISKKYKSTEYVCENPDPEEVTVTIRRFKRSPSVAAKIEELAQGKCELCEMPAPFDRKDGRPFLEVHHIKTLAKNGPDTTDNTVALCPNCHKACHHSPETETHIEALYAKISRLKRY
nr:HNH endonuclease [Kordiimonas marina]